MDGFEGSKLTIFIMQISKYVLFFDKKISQSKFHHRMPVNIGKYTNYNFHNLIIIALGINNFLLKH